MDAKPKKIFLSHASKDKALADKLTDLLTNGCAVNPNDILCTSLEGKGIPAGTPSFIDFLRGQIQEPELVILLLTENFFASHFCMCELGAVWGMRLANFPLVVPPTERGKLKAVLAVAQAGEINSAASLDELRDAVMKRLDASVPTATWTVKRDGFLTGLEEVIESLEKPSVVPVEKLKTSEDQYRAALAEIGNKEKEAKLLKQQISDLEQCKDKDQVKVVNRKYSASNEQFERLCNATKATLNKLQHATRIALYWKLRGERYIPEDNEDWEAVRTAESFEEVFQGGNGFFGSPSGEKDCEPDSTHPRVVKAEQALDELKSFLSDPKDATFAKRFEEEYEFPASTRSKDFWRKFLVHV